ncbi:hypothetical protein PHET_01715 [Paragonimus heterotremus]|uniref:Spermatogenesis-associated protein 1 C-terminal domain-containing protein n=1 Tax=Paragonimus heterotremus TaxID=100268 RepID=A0A8J4TDI3_9TREM|nr:hypothetical protein PHET_01715 [Paragonimus heterotremus]
MPIVTILNIFVDYPVRDEWKRRYYVAKRQAPNLEERMTDHREDLDNLMRRTIASMKHSNPESAEERQIIVSMEKRREVTREEYRLAEVMLSLTKAIKLRTQAEGEGRLLMTELDRRRGEMNLVKSTSPNRRAYVFSLSPRRQAAYRPRLGTLDSSARQTSISPHKSRIGSMTRLQSETRQRKARGRSPRVDQSQSDSDQSAQSTQLRGIQRLNVPRKTNRPNAVSFATPDDLQPRTPSAQSQAATDQ